MQYRKDKKGNQLSILGYGCMRFTKNGSSIDLEKAEQELMYGISHGINYLDTAYVYPGNEEAVGKILAKNHCREEINLATKLPHYLIRTRAGAEKKFQEELQRLQTDYIDYYLMHMLNDCRTWEKLVQIGIRDWIEEKKKSGVIRNIGFSYHGNSENFRALLDAYDWDFCQIQYNYLDEHSSGGQRRTRICGGKGNPGYHHGTASRRQAGQSSAAESQRMYCKKRYVSYPGRIGTSVAMGSAAGDVCALRNEFHRYGKGKYPHRRNGGAKSIWRAGAGADRAGTGGDPEEDEGTMYRMRILHAVPAACGYPDGISLL